MSGNRRRSVLRHVAAAATIGMAGCAVLESKPPIENLELEITDVRKPDAGLTSATVPIVLTLRNAGDEELPSPILDYSGRINDIEVASTRTTVSTLRGGEEMNETIEFIAEYQNVGDAIADAIQTGAFLIELSGDVESDGAVDQFDLQYRYG